MGNWKTTGLRMRNMTLRLYFQIKMLGYDMVVRQVSHKEYGLPIDIMDAVEDVPSGLLAMLECGIEQVCSVAFEIGWGVLSYFNGKIGLDIAEQLFGIRDGRIFETEISSIIEDFGQIEELIDDFWKE